jgi:hypothetical protein
MLAEGLDPTTQPILDQLAPSFLETQQWVDFSVNRSGRSSILTRSDATPERSFTAERLRSLRFGTLWSNVTALNRAPDAPAVFESPQGRRVEVSDPGLQAVLFRLSSDSGASTPHAELSQAYSQAASSPAAPDRRSAEGFERTLGGMIAKGVIEARSAV